MSDKAAEESLRRLFETVDRGNEEEIADGLAAAQEHVVAPNLLSPPILLGVRQFGDRHRQPGLSARLVAKMNELEIDSNSIVMAVALQLRGEDFGSWPECVDYVMSGGTGEVDGDVASRVADEFDAIMVR
jgi:hypothetical protein